MEFMDKPQVKLLFQDYNKNLESYFKFYSAQGKVELGNDMQFRMQNMHYREFVKFGF